MRGAAPRSHFCETPRVKYQIYSQMSKSLEDLTPRPVLAGKLSHSTRKSVILGPATGVKVAYESLLGVSFRPLLAVVTRFRQLSRPL